jgi:integrase
MGRAGLRSTSRGCRRCGTGDDPPARRPRAAVQGRTARRQIAAGRLAGAFRRSELVAVDVGDLEFCESGMRVRIRRSKTDQEGGGYTIAIVSGSIACPVKAVRAWLEASKVTAGPLFRPIGKGSRIGTDRLADHTVVRVVKASARRVGLDPKLFAGHSLRSGFLTSAAGRGASIFKMMDVSRHKSMDTLRSYVRDAELFRDHAGTGLL